MNKFTEVAVIILMMLTAVASAEIPSTEQKNILGTAAATGNLNSFLGAVREAGLESTLNGTGPYTVFTPTDDAFAAIPVNQMNALTDNKTELSSVLMYHIAQGRINLPDLRNGMTIRTLQGSDLDVNIDDNITRLNNIAWIVRANLQASNGVIHEIDTVLVPPTLPLAFPSSRPVIGANASSFMPAFNATGVNESVARERAGAGERNYTRTIVETAHRYT